MYRKMVPWTVFLCVREQGVGEEKNQKSIEETKKAQKKTKKY